MLARRMPPVAKRREPSVPIEDRLTSVPGVAPGPGFAHAVTVSGRLAFVSGQVALDENGQLAGPGDLEADWSDVARFSWYVLDASQVQVIRDVRDEFIRPALGDRPNPASTLVQVAALFRPGFLVEVDAVVALPA
jgi:enamine deaminase RidA (YjgF/YER057c/UK114 family)